jgi:adenosylhomocysteine nucleosidase
MRKLSRLLESVVLLTLLVACRGTPSAPVATQDLSPRLTILSAYQPELEALRERMQVTDRRVIDGRTYYLGSLAGHEVVLLSTGVSMVNAAMTAQTALDHFATRAIIFSGIAGGVNPELNIGDVVVPAQWGQYQESVFARQTADGWDTGWGSDEFGHFGMMFPQPVSVTRDGGRADDEDTRFWFPVDQGMLESAREIVQKAQLERCAQGGECLDHDPKVVVGGNGVSGPAFVDNAEYRLWVWETFKADALDMETSAVAHVAYVNHVPFLAFRSLSDLAGGGPGENEIGIFFQMAAENSAQVLEAFLQGWEQ